MKATYGKLTISELKTLLSWLPLMELSISEVRTAISKDNPELDHALYRLNWSGLYELKYVESLAVNIIHLGLEKGVKNLARQDNPPSALVQNFYSIESSIDYESMSQEEGRERFINVVASTFANYYSLKSMLYYGLYMNDLIMVARENINDTGKNSLFRAIRIDPSVITGPTAVKFIHRATALGDNSFFSELKKAINGKLGKREVENYQKMRLILQVLHETGADKLNDTDLKNLFVEQLNLYSDSQSTSAKNLREFTYNFMKQKPTI